MILFIALSSWNSKPGDWTHTDLDQIPRRCPDCQQESIVGHGRRRRQAHDETHDWIWVRRGLCRLCRATFTFLPASCVPRSRYSLRCWLDALKQWIQYRTAEPVSPAVKEKKRLVDPSTVRRWRRRWANLRSQFSLLPTQFAWDCETVCGSLRFEEAITPCNGEQCRN